MAAIDNDALCGVDAADLISDMAGVRLGDERRNVRLINLLRRLAENPSASFASMCESEAEAEALYRLLRNRGFDWQSVVQPHIDSTCQRARQCGQALILHDTSTFRVADEAELDSYIQTGKRGFFGHVSLALDATDFRRPLGVAAVEVVQRHKAQRRTRKNGRAMSGSETAKLDGRESERWWRAVEQVESRLADTELVHVMDREADSYELLSKLHAHGAGYVIRWCKNRRARKASDGSSEWSKVRDLLDQAQHTNLHREVHVTKRRAKTAPGLNKASPARDARTASLRVTRSTVELKRPSYLSDISGHPPSLCVNVVRVYEPDPPSGQAPIEWVLLTNLPVDHADEVERIIDIYRQRWLIEEFFKALKTGCGYRRRKLTNSQSILNSFAAFLPIASKALAVRHLARDDQAPATLALDEAEMAVIKAKAVSTRKPISAQPTAAEVLAIVARLGGHRKS